MKKAIAITALMLTAVAAYPQVSIGLKGGVNVTKAQLNLSTLDTENQTGFFIGPTLDIHALPLLGVDISVLYNQRGLRLKDAFNGDKDTQNLKYIDVPVNAKLNIGLGSSACFYVATGPQISFYVGDETTREIFQTEQYKLKSSEFSWNAGAGFRVNKIGIGYNFNIALGKTAEVTRSASSFGDTLKDTDLKNRTHQVHLTIYF